ncbi:hypothetical protein [Moorena sp. SIO1G6]|nr:hypothetical protein [Moorena sp. SIO1G6]
MRYTIFFTSCLLPLASFLFPFAFCLLPFAFCLLPFYINPILTSQIQTL